MSFSQRGGLNVSVFGCTGFVGYYLVNRLAKAGHTVLAPFRCDPYLSKHLKQAGDLGQVILERFHLKDEESIERMVRNSDVVVNLIGQPRTSLNFTPWEVNVEGAGRIAGICRQAANKPTLIHVSHMSARPDSESLYMRSKTEGETRVRQELEDAILVRPSMLFGQEDYLLSAIGEYSRFGLATTKKGARALKHPLYVGDLAEGLVRICQDHRHFSGRTFELKGPEALTWRQVLEIFRYYLVQPEKRIHELPRWMFLGLARVLSWEWRMPWFLPDDLRLWESDEIPGKDALGFEHLGMRGLLTTLDEAGNNMVRFYRKPQDLYTIVNPRPKATTFLSTM